MKNLYMVCALACAACAAPPHVQMPDPPEKFTAVTDEGPYSVFSKDMGWQGIELRVSEVRSTGQVSRFHVPYYTTRTSMENNFAVCAFAQFAILSGYSHFSISETEADRHHVDVAFFVELMQDPAELFGERFHQESYPPAYGYGKYCGFFDPFSGQTLEEIPVHVSMPGER